MKRSKLWLLLPALLLGLLLGAAFYCAEPVSAEDEPAAADTADAVTEAAETPEETPPAGTMKYLPSTGLSICAWNRIPYAITLPMRR